MPDAHVRVDFGAPARAPLELLVDSEDDARASPMFYRPANGLRARQLAAGQFGRHELPVELLRYGRAILRLYGPEVPAQVVALDPLVTPEPEDDLFSVGAFLTRIHVPRLQGDQVQRNGRRSGTRTETLRFAGDTAAQIRFWHDNPTVEVVDATTFLDGAGVVVDAPQARPQGRFIAPGAVFGALLVRYEATYTEYTVAYEMPDPVQPFLLTDIPGGVRIEWLERRLPPLLVYVRTDEAISLARVERQVHDWNFSGLADPASFDFDGDEIDIETEVVRVENPVDPQQFVDIERTKMIRFRDGSGRTLRPSTHSPRMSVTAGLLTGPSAS